MDRLIGRLADVDGWLHLIPPEGLGRYLRKLYWLHTRRVVKLHRPMRGDHISVAEPGTAHPELLRKVGWHFYFSLELEPETNGNAIWVPAESADLEPYRTTRSPLHLCLGYKRAEPLIRRGYETDLLRPAPRVCGERVGFG